MNCTNEKALITRLNKIEGQIRGIKKLIEEDGECEKSLFKSVRQNPPCTKQGSSSSSPTLNTAFSMKYAKATKKKYLRN